jgi:hypothetical protein
MSKSIVCENANINGLGVGIKPQCWNNKAEFKVTVYYTNSISGIRECESDTMYLCEECTKACKKIARKYGYKVRTAKL